MTVVLTDVERTCIKSEINTVSIDDDALPLLGYVYNEEVDKSVGSTTPHVLESTGNVCIQLHLKFKPAADPLTPTTKDEKFGNFVLLRMLPTDMNIGKVLESDCCQAKSVRFILSRNP